MPDIHSLRRVDCGGNVREVESRGRFDEEHALSPAFEDGDQAVAQVVAAIRSEFNEYDPSDAISSTTGLSRSCADGLDGGRGTAASKPSDRTGAMAMKIISSTSSTSIIGVMLMLACVRSLPVFIAMPVKTVSSRRLFPNQFIRVVTRSVISIALRH